MTENIILGSCQTFKVVKIFVPNTSNLFSKINVVFEELNA